MSPILSLKSQVDQKEKEIWALAAMNRPWWVLSAAIRERKELIRQYQQNGVLVCNNHVKKGMEK